MHADDVVFCISLVFSDTKVEKNMRRPGYLIIVFLLLSWTIKISAQNPIQVENASTGTRDWQIAPKDGSYAHEIEGYASATSVNKGETITFYVSVSPAQRFNIEIYRLGWYNGDGARYITTRYALIGRTQAFPEANHITGFAECSWILDGPVAEYSWTPPANTTSGVFLAKLISQDNKQSYIVFTVRDDARPSDFLFQTSDTTWQAYNYWPRDLGNNDWHSGKSLYGFPLSMGPKFRRVPFLMVKKLE